MIGLTKLITGRASYSDRLRYGTNGHKFQDAGLLSPVVVWNITSTCNLFCTHCYYSAKVSKRDPNEVTAAEVKRAIDDFAELRVPVLLFSGGEPMLREDIYELCAYATEKGIAPSLSTNGTLIGDAEAKKLKTSGVGYVGISIDGLKEVHDKFRCKKGAFEEAVAAIKTCLSNGMRVSARFTLTEYNKADLFKVVELFNEIGVTRFCLYHLVPTGRAKRYGDISNVERRQIIERLCSMVPQLRMEILTVDNPSDGVIAYLWAKKNIPDRAQAIMDMLKQQGGEGTGTRLVEIDHTGDVHPNQFWLGMKLGSIRERTFKEIWLKPDRSEGGAVLARLRVKPWKLEGKCGACKFQNVCGGFRPRALNVNGELWSEDPSCPLFLEEVSHAGI